jgi:hypothetical protein
MRISTVNARALGSSLIHAAAAAEATGQTDFDLLDVLASVDDEARAQLAAAIAQAGGGKEA